MTQQPTITGIVVTRRATLAGATAMIGAASLAACSAGEPGGSGGSVGTPAADGSTKVKLSDIPVGGGVSAKVGGQPVLLAQPQKGTVVAFSAICTHQGCVVQPANGEFDCPCHGSRFAASTGDILQGPASRPLTKLRASVDGDTVTISS